MARSWQYPRWRRTLMQVVLLLVLAATAALAELVTRQRNRNDIPQLQQSQKIDKLLVKLPTGWDVNTDDPNELIAQEPASDGQGRIMAVRLMHASNATSAAEFLLRSGLLNPTAGGGNQEDDESEHSVAINPVPVEMQPITMAARRGVMARLMLREQPTPDSPEISHNQLIAAVLLPSHSAIVVELDSTQPDTRGDDQRLLKQVAAALQVEGDK